MARGSGDEPSILNGIRQAVVAKSGTVKPFDLQKAAQTLKIEPEELNSRVRPLAAEFLQASSNAQPDCGAVPGLSEVKAHGQAGVRNRA